MRTLCLIAFFSAFSGVLSQLPPNNKSPHPYNFSTSSQRTRRLQGPIEHKRVSFPHFSGSRTPSNARKQQNKKNSVPPYAVQMEPLVQYSQPDPLYTIEKQYISEAKTSDSSTNDIIKKTVPGPMIADVSEAESISRVGQITHARLRPLTHVSPPPAPRQQQRPHHHHHHHHHVPMKDIEFSSYGTYYEGPPEAFEPPEPIIEIIIKESNESLPAPPPLPTPPPPKKKKEPVQVFYVKYKKDPAGGYGGEEKVIYDPPVPAVTPPANNEESHETPEETESFVENAAEEITVPPPPSTTLKAIIHPDSETFHASGVHITFGEPQETGHDHEHHHGELEQQSAPQPAVALPGHTPKPQISRSSSSGTSTLTKRNPAPFNGQQPQFQPSFPQPAAPPSFQQTPHLPPQDFQPPSLNPSQYSTIPQNYQFARPHQPIQSQAQPQRYTTINNPPPAPQKYHTINQPAANLPSSFAPFTQTSNIPQNTFQQQRTPVLSPQDQHQQQVEQVNRLQQQQQQLQQQLAQQYRFQPFPQQPQQQFSQPPPQIQHTQQLSQQQFVQQPSLSFSQQPLFHQQHSNQPLQEPQQQQHNHQPQLQQPSQYRQPPVLQYPTHNSQTNLSNHQPEVKPSFIPTPRPQVTSTTKPNQYKTTITTTPAEEVTELVTEDPKNAEKEKKRKEEQVKKNVANLPDEVPDDLREQLLSSGILSNADIQILDYDKIGDIPVESLPPEALANFQQVAGSERVQVVRKPDAAEDRDGEDSASSSSEQRSVTVKNSKDWDMEMKVVRFNPEKNEGVADRYMKKGATQLAPVVLNDHKYNRYLPLKVSGAQFPVPDVPELRGRNVTSVVVLAPVDYEFLNRRDEKDDDNEGRFGRSASPVLEVQGVRFVAGDILKTLVRMPSTENYRRWLDKENSTTADKQSVVLLVVEPGPDNPDKEIFMYDIASGHVSKLRGELSSTFVQVAESNSHNQDLDEISESAVAQGGDFTLRSASSLISNNSR